MKDPLRTMGDRWLYALEELGQFEIDCIRAHVDITGEAPLQLSVYGAVKDDGPH